MFSEDEMKGFNDQLSKVGKDTLSCWVATRINGKSASVACDGNVSKDLLLLLDEAMKKAKPE